MVLVTQYLDTMRDIGYHSRYSTVFIPHGVDGARDVADQIRNGSMQADAWLHSCPVRHLLLGANALFMDRLVNLRWNSKLSSSVDLDAIYLCLVDVVVGSIKPAIVNDVKPLANHHVYLFSALQQPEIKECFGHLLNVLFYFLFLSYIYPCLAHFNLMSSVLRLPLLQIS